MLSNITNLSTSQTYQHHKLVNITNLSNTTYNMSAKESSKSEVGGCHQKCTSLLTTMTRGHCLLICVCQPSVTGNLSSPAAKRSRPSIQVQEEPFWMLMPVIVVVIIMIMMMMIMMMLRRTPHLLLTLLQTPKWGRCTWETGPLQVSDKLSLVTTFCLRSPSLPLCVTSPANDPLGAVGN